MYVCIKNSKDDGDTIFDIYLIRGTTPQGLFHVCSCCISSFINSWRYHLKINISIVFVSAWHYYVSCPCPWSWWKKKNFLTFLMFKPFFIGYGYYRKSFPKTLICVFMRGVVMNSKNAKWTWMCLLLLLLDVLIGD